MLLTVFTSTYNRAYCLENLYYSLLEQTSKCFEWLIIDDASGDNTEKLVKKWIDETTSFPIRFYKNENNQGLQRNVNKAYELAEGVFCLKVDSDDWLLPDAISRLEKWLSYVIDNEKCLGVGGLYQHLNGKMHYQNGKMPDVDGKGYRDILFYERSKYGFGIDALEAYRVSIRKKYPTPVWHSEKSGPERVSFSDMARDGYFIRYFSEPIAVVNYQNDGLTLCSDKNKIKNPMSMAICYNHYQTYSFYSFRERLKYASEFVFWTLKYGSKSYIFQSKSPFMTMIAFPFGIEKILRRK